MSDPDDLIGVASNTPRHSLGSIGILSYSSGSSISPSSSSSNSAKSAVNECLGAWLNYLQILNNLCTSGYRLAQAIATLEQWGTMQQQQQPSQPAQTAQNQNPHSTGSTLVATQFINAWDDLARATTVATSTVKSHIVSLLQEFVTQSLTSFEPDSDIRDHNQQIIMETTQTMVNIQHQFCVASYDSFSTLMCCFMCHAPVGFPHDSDCGFQKRSGSSDLRSQTPSPHFGPLTMNVPKNDRDIYRTDGVSQSITNRNMMNMELTSARVPSPHQDVRGPSPVHNFLENIRGPLPPPGHLLTMKGPFLHRCSRSPLNFPLFPLNSQRRWSEAAAGEVKGEPSMMDAENMRRWSMPWESKTESKNTVTWHQTRIISRMAVPPNAAQTLYSKTSSDRSQTTTPDSMYQSSTTSQDGLAEAIQLLSCRPSRAYQPTLGQSFAEEQPSHSNVGTYEMWSRDEDRIPCIKFPKHSNKSNDEQTPHPPP
ncbi:uncharacterized protein LOC116340129 [Contarinia nasturtii]|uniref:uncharacterized protein LOC116340129 n=1 Tax=Contarinia nasturtii TaxID=265458 RepID=UPI0012D42846|nr:uncharacterized protein LOC116340129 [Contarinia nasturtii]